jgi:hypothetical protein
VVFTNKKYQLSETALSAVTAPVEQKINNQQCLELHHLEPAGLH